MATETGVIEIDMALTQLLVLVRALEEGKTGRLDVSTTCRYVESQLLDVRDAVYQLAARKDRVIRESTEALERTARLLDGLADELGLQPAAAAAPEEPPAPPKVVRLPVIHIRPHLLVPSDAGGAA